MVTDTSPGVDTDLERLRSMIARHWRRFGWSIWTTADVDLAVERILDIAEFDPQVIRKILDTGIVGGPKHGRC
jgi:hypothetical protein